MTRTLFALSLGFVGLILVTQVAFAGPCAIRSDVVAQLADRYQETRRGMGRAGNDSVVEVFASESGSWTIIVTTPSGFSCLVGSGDGWEPLAEALPAPGDPA
jgi:hypothetical protein